jgi:acetylornithine deacetylase
MDSLKLVDFARKLIDVDSTTGIEGECGALLAHELRELGYSVASQHVSEGRFNVIATLDDPVVVLSTHFDCVPDFFPSRVENGRLYGRGSSDAKGTLAAQVVAAQRLRARGERRVGLLYVVGEERGSDGAKTANSVPPPSVRYLVNGEPTDNRLATATRGVYRVRLAAKGRAAHSSRPDLGDSAIEKLIDGLFALRSASWPSDPVLGQTHYTVGLMSGGVAPNVIPADAGAEIMFRTVGSHEDLLRALETALNGRLSSETVLVVPPVHLKTLPGFDTAVFSFTTDIPFLDKWGTPLLLGPGSVEQAHTKDESVGIDELEQAADLYEKLAAELLK